MKRSIVFIFVVVLALPAVVFAGGQKQVAGSASQSTHGVLSIYWNPDHYYPIYKKIFQSYASSKGLKVNVQILNWNDFHTKITADFAAGTPPDLIEVPAPWIAQFGGSGNLVDLTKRIDSWPAHTDWFKSTWEEVSNNGKLYGMKLHNTAMGLFYNVAEFKQVGLNPNDPPTTLSQFASDVHLLATKIGGGQKGFGFDPTSQYLLPFLASEQTPYLINNNKIAIGTPVVRTTLIDLQKIARSGDAYIPPPGGESARSNLRLLFYTGKVSMFVSGPWELGNLKKYPNLDYSVGMVPHLAGVKGLTLSAGTGLAIPNDASQPVSLVWGLMQKLTSVNTEVTATQEAGMLMPRKTWLADPRVQDIRAVKLFGPLLSKAVPFDIGADKANLPEITWDGSLFDTLYQTMIYSDKNMNQALDTYIAQANKLLAKAAK